MDSALKTIIVDDETLARRGLKHRLKAVEDVQIIAEAGNGREALDLIRKHDPDLVFLDIQMPGMDGFDVLRALPQRKMPAIVFVTAFDDYAIKAFEAHALDYLLKPVDDARLGDALERAREQQDERQAVEHRGRLLSMVAELGGVDDVSLEDLLEKGLAALDAGHLETLPIKDAGNTVCLKTADIDWIDAAGDYMCVHAAGQTHIMRGTMKKLEDVLNPRVFQRVHRSTIVNVNRVRQVRSHINGEYFLILEGNIEVKMSRHYKDKIRHFVPDV